MSHTLFPWRPVFLAALREYPVVQHACNVAGIERCTAYRARQADESFAAEWEDAMEAGIDRAEQEAFRRAVTGFEEPVVYQGQVSPRMEPQFDEDGNPIIDPTTKTQAWGPVRDANGRIVPLTVRKHSDALLALVLKGRRKKVYAERTELTGADGGPVGMVDETARAARAAQLIAAAQARKAREAQEQEFGDLA